METHTVYGSKANTHTMHRHKHTPMDTQREREISTRHEGDRRRVKGGIEGRREWKEEKEWRIGGMIEGEKRRGEEKSKEQGDEMRGEEKRTGG